MADSFSGGGGGGGGGSVTGDGIVENTSAPGGVLSLANAAPYTVLGNSTGSAAAPTYGYGLQGVATSNQTSGSTTLTNASASIQYFNTNLTGTLTINMPSAASCPNKTFIIYRASVSGSNSFVIARNGSDTFTTYLNTTTTSLSLSAGTYAIFISDGISTWYQPWQPILPAIMGGTGADQSPNQGGVAYGASGNEILTNVAAAGAGYILQSGTSGTGSPTWTLTPGSGTALTSITANHDLSGGSTPTFTAGAGAGTTPTISVTGTDKAGYVTVTTGSAPSASAVVVTVTFAVAYGSTPKAVLIGDAASNDAVLSGNARVWADQGGLATTGFTLNVGSTNLAATTTYLWWYHIDG